MDRVFLETKFETDDDGAIEGVAWKCNQPDRIGDVIEKSAFTSAKMPIPMLFGHDQNDPVGVWEAGETKGDDYVIKGRLLVKDVPRSREIAALVASGAVRGISIGFRTLKAANRSGGGRTVKAIELLEASLVAIPMHPGAQVTSAKSAAAALRMAEQINRAAAHLQGNT